MGETAIPLGDELEKSFHRALEKSVKKVDAPRDAEISRLTSERDTLIEALRPFAEQAAELAAIIPDDTQLGIVIPGLDTRLEVTVGDLRKALAAIEKAKA